MAAASRGSAALSIPEPALKQPCYIGIDLGTSGVRACAIDAEDRLIAEARAALPAVESPHPSWAQQAPELWWQATLAACDQLFSECTLEPIALSVDGTSGTLLLCDAELTPLTPGLMYNDARALEQAAQIADKAPADTAVHSPSSALAKLLWWDGQLPKGARYALHQADWIAACLGARPGFSDENNALKLGYDPRSRAWPDWLADLLTPPARELLPTVVGVGTPTGQLSESLCQRWQLQGPVNLLAGTTDSNAAALASGLREPGDACTSLGSTLALKLIAEQPVFSAKDGIYSHRIGHRWLLGGASNAGGSSLLAHFSIAQMQALEGQLSPEKNTGLDYYPLPRPGERFPINDPHLQPRITPRPKDDAVFFQGLLEGLAHIEWLGYQRLHALGAPYPSRVLSSGGGSHNAAWQQIRARQLGVDVAIAPHDEASYGSALIAHHGVRVLQ